jgi:hypothetical protein
VRSVDEVLTRLEAEVRGAGLAWSPPRRKDDRGETELRWEQSGRLLVAIVECDDAGEHLLVDLYFGARPGPPLKPLKPGRDWVRGWRWLVFAEKPLVAHATSGEM